ncbi:MAG: ABC transporter ATP-binding protein, partial [Planctomycetes bacterium]|nr:ABC transporter ATP-binding protein [Planctomycetota bacterium]
MKVFRRLLGYFFRYKARIVALAVLTLVISILYFGTVGSLKPIGDLLFDPEGTRELADSPFFQEGLGRPLAPAVEWLATADRETAIYWLCGGVLAIALLKNFLRFFQNYLTHAIEKSVTRDLNDHLFDKVERLSIRHFQEEEGVARTISRFTNDSYLLAAGVRNIFADALIEPLQGFAALGVALMIDWKLTLLALLVLPGVGALIATLGRKVKRRTKKSLERKADLQAVLQESLMGVRTVKAFRAEDAELERFRAANRRYYKNEMRVARLDSITSPILEMISTAAIMTVIFVTARRVLSGAMSVGDFFAFYGALAAIFDPARKIAKLVNKFQMSMAAGERIFELMDTAPEVVDPPGAVELPRMARAIRFEGVSFEYRPAEPVLSGIDLVVPRLARLGIVGKTGHGKSTLVNLLLRYYDATSGRITLDGTDVRSASLASLRSQIGLVSQEVFLFNDTIARNISYGRRDATAEEIAAAARAAHADEFIRAIPGGYEATIGELGMTLSGGQRQRISIARAILKDPEILVLDEATSSLDSESEALIQEALERFVENRTCFIVSHRMSTLAFCDRIVVLDRGRIEAQGSHDELLES